MTNNTATLMQPSAWPLQQVQPAPSTYHPTQPGHYPVYKHAPPQQQSSSGVGPIHAHLDYDDTSSRYGTLWDRHNGTTHQDTLSQAERAPCPVATSMKMMMMIASIAILQCTQPVCHISQRLQNQLLLSYEVFIDHFLYPITSRTPQKPLEVYMHLAYRHQQEQ